MLSLASSSIARCSSIVARSSSSVITPLIIMEQQRFRSSSVNAAVEDGQPKGFFPVYVHHVSKIALEHMQESQSDWLMEKGLDRGLYINANGTFVMNFPARKGFDSGRIWTSYDAGKKQHWLSVYRQKLAVRFLLKDHGKCMTSTKVHNAALSEKRIQAAVDQMIKSINQIEESKRNA